MVWALALLSAAAGCGDGLPDRVPVSGRVLIDGQPLTMGQVKVVPANERAAQGAVQPDGTFMLSCYKLGDGSVPGTHKVAVVASEQLGERSLKWHAPQKYADLKTSGLEVTIDGPTDELVINLSWDGGKPFVQTW